MAANPIPSHTQSSFRHLRHTLSDPEEFSTAVSGAILHAEFFRAPECKTTIEQFQSFDWALDFYEARVNARIMGVSPPGWGSIALIRNEMPSQWYGIPSRRGMLVFTPPDEAIDGCIKPGFQGVGIHASPSVWEKCRQLAVNDPERTSNTLQRHGTVRAIPSCCFNNIDAQLLSLRNLLSTVNHNKNHFATSAKAKQLVIELITLAWEFQEDEPNKSKCAQQSPGNRARLAYRAEEWLRDHLNEHISMSDLCQAFRVSRREMEYAFRQAFDQSPRYYLQALRLNSIYHTLRRSVPDRGEVTKIAMEHGITHLGRFAAQYRELFGEMPRCSLINRNPIPPSE